MSENKRTLLSLTETDVVELRNILEWATVYHGAVLTETVLTTCDKWNVILTSAANVMSSPVDIHFTDLGTEP